MQDSAITTCYIMNFTMQEYVLFGMAEFDVWLDFGSEAFWYIATRRTNAFAVSLSTAHQKESCAAATAVADPPST